MNHVLKPLSRQDYFSSLLEQAWAEIEHKQKYKSKVALPPDLQRRLNILSGNLELIDRELSRIAVAADEYKKKLFSGDVSLATDFLSTSSFRVVCEKFSTENNIPIRDPFDDSSWEKRCEVVIEELKNFGISTVSELQGLLEKLPIEKFLQYEDDHTLIGLTRDAMIIQDHNKFFNESYNDSYDFSFIDIEKYNGIIGENDIPQRIQAAGGEVTSEEM
ncbi:hypothetical protein N6L27_22850 [Leisingera sp. SS27]|uniref:hypothetical protein n=1 Tax=Leisingera sp. SS27 TaxID=2979462 RepID=UPI00233022EF|nr:hypothetical protein [Leisingera sp. SS27]MDC0660855.1 hypothetical protein [Leisingera sp. SS27]